MNFVQPLTEKGLQCDRVENFVALGGRGEKVDGFNDFFVEVDEISGALSGLLEAGLNEGGNLGWICGASFVVIAVNGAQDIFREHLSEVV